MKRSEKHSKESIVGASPHLTPMTRSRRRCEPMRFLRMSRHRVETPRTEWGRFNTRCRSFSLFHFVESLYWSRDPDTLHITPSVLGTRAFSLSDDAPAIWDLMKRVRSPRRIVAPWRENRELTRAVLASLAKTLGAPECVDPMARTTHKRLPPSLPR